MWGQIINEGNEFNKILKSYENAEFKMKEMGSWVETKESSN